MKQQRHPIFVNFWLMLTILNCVNDVVGAYCCYYKCIYNIYNYFDMAAGTGTCRIVNRDFGEYANGQHECCYSPCCK